MIDEHDFQTRITVQFVGAGTLVNLFEPEPQPPVFAQGIETKLAMTDKGVMVQFSGCATAHEEIDQLPPGFLQMMQKTLEHGLEAVKAMIAEDPTLEAEVRSYDGEILAPRGPINKGV